MKNDKFLNQKAKDMSIGELISAIKIKEKELVLVRVEGKERCGKFTIGMDIIIGMNINKFIFDNLYYQNLLNKPVKERTEKEHIKLVKYFGGVREYLLSMGNFKDVPITDNQNCVKCGEPEEEHPINQPATGSYCKKFITPNLDGCGKEFDSEDIEAFVRCGVLFDDKLQLCPSCGSGDRKSVPRGGSGTGSDIPACTNRIKEWEKQIDELYKKHGNTMDIRDMSNQLLGYKEAIKQMTSDKTDCTNSKGCGKEIHYNDGDVVQVVYCGDDSAVQPMRLCLSCDNQNWKNKQRLRLLKGSYKEVRHNQKEKKK